jgi:hypothetical protein
VVDSWRQVHPFVGVGWTVLVSVYKVQYGCSAYTDTKYLLTFQVAKAEVDRDEKITDLIRTIADVFTFAGAVDRVKKIDMYQDVIGKLWKQTYECALFIQEYKGHGFARKFSAATILSYMSG